MPQALGIDFGTTNSTVAAVNADGDPRVLRDAEGQDKTPSLVYYGDGELLVGTPADDLLRDSLEAADDDVAARLIRNIKRELLHPPRIALPGARTVRPVEVAAAIFAKLRHDAAQADGGEPPLRAVVTCPAVFDGAQRGAIRSAATQAGFVEVEMLQEPVAAALAFAHWGKPLGDGVVVHDFGGGTFDVAFVARPAGGERYDVALEADGDAHCGGHDLDLELYSYWDEQARRELGRPIAGDGGLSPRFLRQCRYRKESLSRDPHAHFSTRLADGTIFESEIDRATFERLIGPWIDRTVGITRRLADRARADGFTVDSVVLVGGSSRVPLVRRRLGEELGVDVLAWEHQDVAVAIGAALEADRLWGDRKPRRRAAPEDEAQDRLQLYRSAVEQAWSDRRIDAEDLRRLKERAAELRIAAVERARIEYGVLGATAADRFDVIKQRVASGARTREAPKAQPGKPEAPPSALQRTAGKPPKNAGGKATGTPPPANKGQGGGLGLILLIVLVIVVLGLVVASC